MKYEVFEFSNYKGIESLKLKMTENVSTLIGLNESGKTTILEGIFCFSYGSDEELDFINPGLASLRNPEHWIPISKRANFNDTISISATVSLDNNDLEFISSEMYKQFGLKIEPLPNEMKITESHLFKNSRFVKTKRHWTGLQIRGTKGKQKTSRSYGDKTEEWLYSVSVARLALPRIWYFPNFLFELPDRFQINNLDASVDAGDNEELDKFRFYRETFQEILTQVDSDGELDPLIIQRLPSTDRADQRALDATLLEMGRLVTSKVFEGWNRIFGRDPGAQEVQFRAEQESPGEPAFMELRIKGPDGFYDLHERSLGFRWFFTFLLLTSFSQNSATRSKGLILLDEPASNLHSSAQAELLKSFDDLSTRNYLIYTTHSHHLINLRWLDAAYVVKNAALGDLNFSDYVTSRLGARTSISATRYRTFVNENPDSTSYIQPVLDLLDYRPSVLEPVPKIVLVEGKSDFYYLRYLLDILGLGPKVNLAPGGGAGSLDTLISLYIGWGGDFVVLLDGDSEGSEQQKRYIAKFGPIMKQKCLTLADIVESTGQIELEDLISQDGQKIFLDKSESDSGTPASKKKSLRRAVAELYAKGEAVPLDAESVDMATRVFEQLARRLP